LGLEGFTFVDHTADLAARLEAPALSGLYEAAAGALTAALTIPERVEPRLTRTIVLEARDPELLLVDWVAELLYCFETEGYLVSDATVGVAAPLGAGGHASSHWRLDATVAGETRDPARHPLKVLVKGITFHRLKIEERDGRYETLLVFDI
jgi:SHS2 domain-containing protein